MAEPKLIVKKADGSLLFDTRYITYGLVKSGYMSLLYFWTRRAFKGGNVDPAIGANWTESQQVAGPTNSTDDLHGFTVPNARSPIVFITGGGSLISSSRNPDGSMTFNYSGASTASKFYCYDLMADNIPGGPFLKTRKEDGTLTFNSLQPPLNIYTSVQAPPKGGNFSATTEPYAGGRAVIVFSPLQRQMTIRYFGTVQIQGGPGELAAHLPWSRGCTCVSNGNTNSGLHWRTSQTEGVAGGVNQITFALNETAGAPFSDANPGTAYGLNMFYDLAPNPRPVALVMRTAGVPFPYN